MVLAGSRAGLRRPRGGAPRGGVIGEPRAGATWPGALISCRRSPRPRELWWVGRRPARTPAAAGTPVVWPEEVHVGDQGEAADFDHMVADLQRQINQDRYVMSLMNQFAHTLIICDN